MNILSEAENNELFEIYSKLYTKALPEAGNLNKNDFEIAAFGISENIDEFKKVGLGLKIVSEYVAEYNHALIGHTGKILISLPWQFMPEHRHTDIEILKKGYDIPDGYQKVSEKINKFEGILQYNQDGSVKKENENPIFKFKDSDYTIIMPTNYNAKLSVQPEFHFEGKSETFKLISGDAILFSDDAKVLRSPVEPFMIPDRFINIIEEIKKNQKITTKSMFYMTDGCEILIPKHTKHALVGGEDGAVFIEFSTPSIDEADMFTDDEVIR